VLFRSANRMTFAIGTTCSLPVPDGRISRVRSATMTVPVPSRVLRGVYASERLSRPIFHKLDETIRGHVFCSFLALVLKKALEDRIAALGRSGSWPDIIPDLDSLTETEIEHDGKTLRRPLRAASRREPRIACGRRRTAADRPRSHALLTRPIRKCSAKPPKRREFPLPISTLINRAVQDGLQCHRERPCPAGACRQRPCRQTYRRARTRW
jgi:hypothetical protein